MTTCTGTIKMNVRTPLAARADKMLKLLRDMGPGWHSRPEIARVLGKARLHDSEVAALELLVERGVLEAERREIPGPIPQRWEYRLKQS